MQVATDQIFVISIFQILCDPHDPKNPIYTWLTVHKLCAQLHTPVHLPTLSCYVFDSCKRPCIRRNVPVVCTATPIEVKCLCLVYAFTRRWQWRKSRGGRGGHVPSKIGLRGTVMHYVPPKFGF